MNPSRINKIDQLLEALKKDADAKKLQDFLGSVCDAIGLSHNTNELFDSNNDPPQKKFIAVCLLRLLYRSQGAIWEWENQERPRIVGLFDDQISSIYRLFDINNGDQNHDKLNKLRNAEESVLNAFSQITDSIVDFSTSTGVRHRFMQTCNYDLNRLFLEQFVRPPSIISNERLSQIFHVVNEYNESSMENLLESYKEVETIFDRYLREADKYPSTFTQRCITDPIKRIYDFINEDFQNNDATQATTVTISSLDHKYPFHEKGRKIELKFLVKNNTRGYAFDVRVECKDIDECLNSCDPVNLGTLTSSQSLEIVLETEVTKIGSRKNLEPLIELTWSWQSLISDERSALDEMFELRSQRTNLNWDDLKKKQPYSLEAINEAENLVGRKALMENLQKNLLADRIGSSIIYGQKRVGKTSIAEVVKANFDKEPNYLVVFVSVTGCDTTSPEKSVSSIGTKIVRQVSRAAKPLANLDKPTFENALAPLAEYFEDAKEILPEYRFIIILDEFDEIHPDLVTSESIGQTFFNNIRDLSSVGYVGFVLVGGENMQIIRESISQLNKMSVIGVNYFDKKKQYQDFQDLVRQPVKNTIEFSDEAINALYEITEGHPYYTKCICSEIYKTACEERNAYISNHNVEKAIQEAINMLDMPAFSHIWTDGIDKKRHDSARQDQIQTRRRKFLIAFTQIKRKEKLVTRKELSGSEILGDVSVSTIIEKYINRDFLVEENGNCKWKPKFFERWLIESGFSKLTGEFLNEEAIQHLEDEEEKAYVRSKEIVDLCEKWGLYRSGNIDTERVRAWLEQFEYKSEQRLMFKLLENVRFYKEVENRTRLRDLQENVDQYFAQKGVSLSRPADRRTRRGDILLSSFGSIGKSGSAYARMYSQENNIYAGNVVHISEISEALEKNNQIKVIIFVDDIIASGKSAIDYLKNFNVKYGTTLKKKDITVFIFSICSLQSGIDALENFIKKEVPFKTTVKAADLLSESDQCFSSQSKIFSSSKELEQAKHIAEQYGKRLDRQRPFGYNNSQLIVVFPDNCPNNTLPILWKKSKEWTPLFERR